MVYVPPIWCRFTLDDKPILHRTHPLSFKQSKIREKTSLSPSSSSQVVGKSFKHTATKHVCMKLEMVVEGKEEVHTPHTLTLSSPQASLLLHTHTRLTVAESRNYTERITRFENSNSFFALILHKIVYKSVFGIFYTKKSCLAAHTMTLGHFGYVSKLLEHSEYLFFDPDLGLLKLQDVCGKNKIT